jgi:hypothetical protein
MWSRHLLLWGLASAVAAAALALALLWLLLVAIERTHAAAPLQIHVLVVFGLPGLLIYPACWYATVFRNRRYDAHDTWRLLATSYVACCLFDFAVLASWQLYQGVVLAAQILMKSPSPLAFVFLLAPIGTAIFVLIAGALLAIPYAVAAAPVAFLHRAVLLAWFARAPEAA